LVAVGVVGVGWDAVVGVEPVEGLLQVAGGGLGVGGAVLEGWAGAAVVQAPAGAGLMVGATATNLFVLGESPWLPIGLLLVSALIAWGRRSRTKALAGWLQR
jgi:hypothetical protein